MGTGDVMDTADFGTHLAAGRWRSTVLSYQATVLECDL